MALRVTHFNSGARGCAQLRNVHSAGERVIPRPRAPEILHHPVFQRMKRDDRQPSAGLQNLHRRRPARVSKNPFRHSPRSAAPEKPSSPDASFFRAAAQAVQSTPPVAASSQTFAAARSCTIAFANRRESRSPPNSQKILASSSALAPFTRSAAVSDCRVSIRMSSGPSCWKLNPRSGRIQLRRTHAQIQQHAVATRRRNPVRPVPQNCRWRISNRPANSASRARAASTAAPSRSHPNSHPVGELAAKMLAACPAPPTVPSA